LKGKIFKFEANFLDGIEDNNNWQSPRSRLQARNVKINRKEALIVLIDGEKEQIESFIRFLKENKPENAVVEEIRVEEYHGTVRDIEKFRASFTSTQLSKIIRLAWKCLGSRMKRLQRLKRLRKL